MSSDSRKGSLYQIQGIVTALTVSIQVRALRRGVVPVEPQFRFRTGSRTTTHSKTSLYVKMNSKKRKLSGLSGMELRLAYDYRWRELYGRILTSDEGRRGVWMADREN